MGFKSEVKDMMDSGNYEYVEPDWLLSLNATPSDDGVYRWQAVGPAKSWV